MPGCFWKSIEVANFPNFRLHLCQRLNPWIQWWLSKVMQWIDLDEIMNIYYHYHYYYYYVYYFYLSHYYYYWNDLKYLKASKRKVGNRIRSFDAWNPVSQLWTRWKKNRKWWDEDTTLNWCCFLDVSTFYSETLATPKHPGPHKYTWNHMVQKTRRALSLAMLLFCILKLDTLGKDLWFSHCVFYTPCLELLLFSFGGVEAPPEICLFFKIIIFVGPPVRGCGVLITLQ